MSPARTSVPNRTETGRTGNRILDRLDPTTRDGLLHEVSRTHLDRRTHVWRAGATIDQIAFPVTAVVSLRTMLRDGSGIEASTIGNEGVVGLPAMLGERSIANVEAICQVPGEAYMIPVQRLDHHVDGKTALEETLRAHVLLVVLQAMQSVACNRRHTLEERFARWMLMMHDRAGRDEFPMTQEFVAEFLGTHRPSVTLAARVLQQAGVIDYGRGRIRIVDRAGLESVSCECYEVIRDEYDRILPSGAPQP